MKEYFKFLKRKIYLGILMALGCAMLGSVLGARKESKEPLAGITQEDIQNMRQTDREAPDLVGILPLAAEQNQWYNFKYALIFGLAGIISFCGLMAVYQRYFHIRLFVAIRSWLGAERDDLFLDLQA